MADPSQPRVVHVVSHGPHCLDGVASAVAIARYHDHADVRPKFSNNPSIDEILRGIKPDAPLDEQELWVTDISWLEPETDAHLRELARRGLRIYWIDHHKTAIDRVRKGEVDVPFAGSVVDDRHSAARLVFDYLRERLRREGRENRWFESFEPLALMADDNDRWIHAIDGSWELALTLRSMNGPEAFEDLLRMEEPGKYTPRMKRAFERVGQDLRRSFEIAEASRTDRRLDDGVTVVAAACDGYPSEIGDRWGKATGNAVFVLFDLRSAGISFRRSPDCGVDLSRLALAFGGGGHPAAAGCEMPDLLKGLSSTAGDRVAEELRRMDLEADR